MRAYFMRRRVTGLVLLAAAVAGLVVGWQHYQPLLRNLAYFTGWGLLAVMLFLTVYNVRKKLPFLPLGSSRLWLQLHAYVGYFSGALFLAHISWRPPTGTFEITLTTLYLLVALSGVAGLIWSRYVPRRLTARGGEVLYDRIPIVRRHLQDQAESLALASVPAARSTAIADFYVVHLADFFRRPANLWRHVLEIREPMNRLQGQIDDLNRFLNEEQRKVLAEIGDLVRQKDGLDYQYAMQSTLKLWLFAHIPLTYSLLLLTALHVVLVYGFSMGAGFR